MKDKAYRLKKAACLRRIKNGQETIAEVASRFGVTYHCVYFWVTGKKYARKRNKKSGSGRPFTYTLSDVARTISQMTAPITPANLAREIPCPPHRAWILLRELGFRYVGRRPNGCWVLENADALIPAGRAEIGVGGK